MGLVIANVTAAARILLNETSPVFWLASDLTEFITQAALDISARSLCVEATENITLTDGVQDYPIATSTYLRILGAKYVNGPKGLFRMSPWMEGINEVTLTGEPKYFYDYAFTFSIAPIPSSSVSGHIVKLFLAVSTNDLTIIPDKYYVPAVLFVTAMGLVKEKQYAKAGQLMNLYSSLLSFDRQDNVMPKLSPPPTDTYILKASAGVPQNAQ